MRRHLCRRKNRILTNKTVKKERLSGAAVSFVLAFSVIQSWIKTFPIRGAQQNFILSFMIIHRDATWSLSFKVLLPGSSSCRDSWLFSQTIQFINRADATRSTTARLSDITQNTQFLDYKSKKNHGFLSDMSNCSTRIVFYTVYSRTVK